ncbi:MAG: hypothetical protein GTO55_10880 [Armatimonadetes bacterium]|nr:hypothetical protein [Armatimonadota bacterium]NIM77131.1 hypothetical protein [Armatimonadota bacterium]
MSRLGMAATAWLVMLVLSAGGLAEAMRTNSKDTVSLDVLPSISTSESASELLHVSPKGDLSLKVSYQPEADSKGSFFSPERGANLASMGSGLSGQNSFRPHGKGTLLAEYKPSSSLSMSFSFANSFKPGAGKEHDGQTSSNLAYDIDYAPSANSRLTAAWKYLKKETGAGKQAYSKQSAELGYELKFSGGLLRLGRKTLLSSTGSSSNQQAATSLHAEWSRPGKISFTADHATKQLTTGTQRSSTLKGKIALSPRTSTAFSLRREDTSSSPQKARADLSLAADLGSKRAPLQLTGRMIRDSVGSTSGALGEIGFKGGIGEEELGLKFSGKIGRQQGNLADKPAGRLRNLQAEANYSRFRLTGRSESFDSEEGADRRKTELRTGYAISSAAEIFWLRRKQRGSGISGYEELGVEYHLPALELGLGHVERPGATSGETWDSARLLWKMGGELPEWAKNLGEKPQFADSGEGKKYGFSSSPSWAKSAEPGVEISWRKRSGSSGGPDSLRFIYRKMLGGLHLRTGHESNPWKASNSSEQLNSGQRDFLEVGLPLNEKLTGVVRLSRSEGLTQGSRGIFFSLAGKLSEAEKLECFFTNETKSESESDTVTARVPIYGLIYSNKRSEEQYLTMKAAVRPSAGTAEDLERWRIEIAFSRPF